MFFAICFVRCPDTFDRPLCSSFKGRKISAILIAPTSPWPLVFGRWPRTGIPKF